MEIYEQFNCLLLDDKLDEILELLHEFKNSRRLMTDEMGWVYWNISDANAVQRKYQMVYENHVKFVEWGKAELFPDRLHWFVSDATQALTLSLGDYFEEWFNWYLYACQHSTRTAENRGIRFESHRAAIGSLLKLKKLTQIEIPFSHMCGLLQEDHDWENHTFAAFTYYTLLLEKVFMLDEQELLNDVSLRIRELLEQEVKGMLHSSTAESQSYTALGSWLDLNTSRQAKGSMTVLLYNLGCTYHAIGKYEESIEMFRIALDNNSTVTNYGLALYLSSIWNVGGTSREVIDVFNTYSSDGTAINDLFRYAPDLSSIVTF
ncbi:tetratricopeptide repeat protein [Sporosarcina sp. Te-1]|uniref:tetratricopeptide repeat protein n=1 Tax=Sporosarcina sp. Te-1 TaxID=2818390 RepID=UPI001A9DA7B1|nr:tetratricopeptide repeat protein [Sporosarcina sp. Te-1]QTD42129.1 tetratricopeptide repeat protein [Sporosarcina sp. Te-1]